MTQKLLSLNGKWHFTHVRHKDPQALRFANKDFIPIGWLEAEVPGEVHLDLMRLGKIQGYDYGLDKSERTWVEEQDWWYWRDFFVPDDLSDDCVRLVFHGLDTFATVWLNGERLGESEDMFLPAVFEVRDKLHFGGRNVLTIQLRSAVKEVENWDITGLYSTTTLDRIHARKAQMNYFWDFCGRQVSCGIWREVEIQSYTQARIDDLCVRTRHIQPEGAELELEIAVETFGRRKPKGFAIQGEIRSPQGRRVLTFSRKIPTSRKLLRERLKIERPQLWWPWEFGEPRRYRLQVKLVCDEEILDSCEIHFGVRKIELIQEPQQEGISFQFAINGRRFFVKGANWVPLNQTYADITVENYRRLLMRATEGNITMLRVWGGGIYEHDSFYDLCDELGILIFHDFMFACGVYPQHPKYLELCRREAEYQVRRLRNHPCLALWSGDNENDQAYHYWAKARYPDDPFFQTHDFQDNAITRKILPEVCQRLRPDVPYIPSSPFSPTPGADPTLETEGDGHHYFFAPSPDDEKFYYKNYGKLRSRFESEFGFVSFPNAGTYHRLNFRARPLKELGQGAFKGLFKLDPTTGQPVSMDEAIFATQLFHASGLKYAIEHFRQHKWECGGTLYWKFNDPLSFDGHVFPAMMCAVDFNDQLKIAYYYTRRAYQPLLISFKEEGEKLLSLWFTSDLNRKVSGQVLLQRWAFTGQIRSEQKFTVDVQPEQSLKVAEILWESDWRSEEEYLYSFFKSREGQAENWYFLLDFLPLLNLNLPRCQLSIVAQWRQRKRKVHLKLRSDIFARAVRLQIPDVAERMSDNCFDLNPGQTKEVVIDTDGLEVDEPLAKMVLVKAVNSDVYRIELAKV